MTAVVAVAAFVAFPFPAVLASFPFFVAQYSSARPFPALDIDCSLTHALIPAWAFAVVDAVAVVVAAERYIEVEHHLWLA